MIQRTPHRSASTARLLVLVLVLALLALLAAAVSRSPAPSAAANAASAAKAGKSGGKGGNGGPDMAGDEQPNFLHILTDDQTVDSIRYMPILKRALIKRGTSFTDYQTAQPLCCPSRASFLTGEYPHNHGVLNNGPPYGFEALDFSKTIYTALHDDGYQTGWIGKVLNVSGDQGIEPQPGFDEWFTPLRATELNMYDYEISDNGTERSYRGPYQSDVFANQAQKFLADQDPSRPFMLTLALTSPHWTRCDDPYVLRCPPQPAPEDYGSFDGVKFPFGPDFTGSRADRAYADDYWARELESMQSVDRIVGELVSQLKQSGELDNTYIIFQSDNGYLHGEHGIFDKNVPWDKSVRVPLIIRGPGFAKRAKRSDLTANVDVPKTILDAAGVASPLPMDGYSLLSRHRRHFMLMEKLAGNSVPKFKAWREIKTAGGWTYFRRIDGTGKRYLFDLKRDPYQVHNRYKRDPKLARKLEHKLEKYADCAAPCP